MTKEERYRDREGVLMGERLPVGEFFKRFTDFQVGHDLGISPVTVYRWRHKGTISPKNIKMIERFYSCRIEA